MPAIPLTPEQEAEQEHAAEVTKRQQAADKAQTDLQNAQAELADLTQKIDAAADSGDSALKLRQKRTEVAGRITLLTEVATAAARPLRAAQDAQRQAAADAERASFQAGLERLHVELRQVRVEVLELLAPAWHRGFVVTHALAAVREELRTTRAPKAWNALNFSTGIPAFHSPERGAGGCTAGSNG